MPESHINIEKKPSTMPRLSKKRATEIFAEIRKKLGGEKRYKDGGYSAAQLARELALDKRIISAAIAMKTGDNYNALVNAYRLEEAKKMLVSAAFEDYTTEEIGLHAGFASRQAFYHVFSKVTGCTPRQYRIDGKVKKEKSSARKSTTT